MIMYDNNRNSRNKTAIGMLIVIGKNNDDNKKCGNSKNRKKYDDNET